MMCREKKLMQMASLSSIFFFNVQSMVPMSNSVSSKF